MKHNGQDYLLAIWELSESYGSANEKEVSERLGISLPSAWEGIHRLEKEKQLRVGKEGLSFTPTGHSNAKKVARAHRITEFFLYSYLEVPWEKVHNSVMNLEHDFPDNLLANLYKKMGSPSYCPHGNPISPGLKMREVSTSDAPEGSYYFVRPVLEEHRFLKQLLNSGSVPGKRVRLERSDRSTYLTGENGELKIPARLERTVRLATLPVKGFPQIDTGIEGTSLFETSRVSS